MPGMVLDPEDTDKYNMLPFCSKSSLCCKDRQQNDSDHTDWRCSDKGKLIGGACKIAGRERCASRRCDSATVMEDSII